ncbi:ABC-type lipoprotein release transport system permease subunit [Tumebacillus sp. BK434]|uniref:FtsX-like permease family protein n=1 Tax=Tumebacillus sp. BK434 TaxID=2512169 RepID=UPI001042DE0D|nr:FtsX-like permease family protein [Tumebacillus sp. BK434]TCP52770.1 ABC-type lipoprotein release transport system permease subunit [Tumebacillus sp. BK434]
MRANMTGLALNILKAKKGRTLFSVLGAMFGVGLLAAMLVLYGKMDAALAQQFVERYGDSDLMAGYRHERKIMSPELVETVTGTAGVAEHGVILVNPQQYSSDYDGRANGMYYVGADNSAQAKRFYKFTQDLGAGEAALSQKLAKRLGVGVGDTAQIPFPSGKTQAWKVAELLPERAAASGAVPEMVLFNLTSLQERFALPGQANLVLLKLEPDMHKNAAYTLLKTAANDLDIDLMEGLDEAKELIVFLKGIGYSLGVLALLASALFVLSNFQLAVQERVRELAALRAIGGSRGQVFRLVLTEATLIGGVGAGLGLGLGVLLATMSSAWIAGLLDVQMAEAPLPWTFLLATAAAGWAFYVLLALLPARKAVKVLPIQAARESALAGDGKGGNVASIALLLVFAAASAACFVTGQRAEDGSGERALLSVLGGLSGVIGVFAGVPFLAPFLLNVLSVPAEWLGGRESFVAVKNLIAERKKSTLTILVVAIGITLALSVTTVLNVLYESTMDNLRQTYVTDFVVSSSKSVNSELSLAVTEEIKQIPGVQWATGISLSGSGATLAQYDYSRSLPEWKEENGGPSPFANVPRYQTIGYNKVDLKEMENVGLLPKLQGTLAETVVFPRKYAEGLGVQVGDRLQVNSGRSYTVTVGAIVDTLPGQPYQELGVYLDQSHPIQPGPGFTIDLDNALAILVEIDPVKRVEVLAGFSALEGKYAELRYTDLQTEMNKQEQGFALERSILWSVVCTVMLVGVLGMINTLAASIQAKRREYAILRAISVTPRQLVKMVLTQSGLYVTLAVLVGLGGAALMVAGFTQALGIETLRPPWGTIGLVVDAVYLVTLLVSLPMAWKMGRETVTRALAME